MSRASQHPRAALRTYARALRRRGYTYSEICAKLGTVPNGTLAYWFNDIHLNGTHQARIRAKIVASAARGRPLARMAWAKKVGQWKAIRERQATVFVRSLRNLPSAARLACAMLYMAEGQQYPATRHLGFSNSKPAIVALFLALLRKSFDLDEAKFRCRVSRRYDQDYQELVSHWSRVTSIPSTRFFKSKPDPRTRGKPTTQVQYRGVCVVYYLDVNVQYTLQAIGEAFGRLVEQEGAPMRHRASALPRHPALRAGPPARSSNIAAGVRSLPAPLSEKKNGGAEGDRTPYLRDAIAALSQVSYCPRE